MTEPAKDTNYFHQTLVSALQFCLPLNQPLLTRVQSGMHFKGILYFKASKKPWILSFPSSRRDRRSDIPWKCFYLRVFSVLLQCHQNIKTLKPRCKRFPQGLLQEKFISKIFLSRSCTRESAWTRRSMPGVVLGSFRLHLLKQSLSLNQEFIN